MYNLHHNNYYNANKSNYVQEQLYFHELLLAKFLNYPTFGNKEDMIVYYFVWKVSITSFFCFALLYVM